MTEVIGQKEAIDIVLDDAKSEIEVCAVMRGVRPLSDCDTRCEYREVCRKIRVIANMTYKEYEKSILG